VAKAIHKFSARGKKDFYPVNCPSIPEALFESQFFGHTRQAFTGAVNSQGGSLVKMMPIIRGFQRLSALDTIESRWIRFALLEYKHNITRAAKGLGISRSTLHRKTEKYKL